MPCIEPLISAARDVTSARGGKWFERSVILTAHGGGSLPTDHASSHNMCRNMPPPLTPNCPTLHWWEPQYVRSRKMSKLWYAWNITALHVFRPALKYHIFIPAPTLARGSGGGKIVLFFPSRASIYPPFPPPTLDHETYILPEHEITLSIFLYDLLLIKYYTTVLSR